MNGGDVEKRESFYTVAAAAAESLQSMREYYSAIKRMK